MALTCKEATRISLAALGGHAAEAQRLELEDHLGGCVRCGDRHGASLAIVRGLKEAETETLSAGARESVRRAVTAAPPAVPLMPGSSGGWLPRLALGFAVAGAVVAAVAGLHRVSQDVRVAVVAGDVTIEDDGGAVAAVARAEGVPGPGGDVVMLNSVRGGRAQVADATVDLEGGTELWWSVKGQVGHLRRGRVTVDVEHRPGRHLEVRTSGFVVQVVGTRFTVDAAGVRTERGLVRVVMPDGRLAARLQAGQSWSLPAPAPAPVALGAGPVARAATATAPALRPARAGAGQVMESRSGQAGTPSASADDGLRLARHALGRGDAAAARRLVAPLFRQARKIAVEARAIFAESFLIEGRYADAIDGFRLVVRDFSGTQQAESAQFAVAQLESEHGHASDARAALQSYLSRYPRGRFVREATERLKRLPAGER